MAESEYKEQNARLEKYNNIRDRISVITRKKSEINNGILSINCAYDKVIDFDYLGDDFKGRLLNNIISFLYSEIEASKKSMENV